MEEMSKYESVIKDVFNDKGSDWKPSDKIPIIVKEIDEIKLNLKSFLKDSKYDVDTIFKDSKLLHQEGLDLIKQMEECEREIKEETLAEIMKSKENHDKLLKELDKLNFLTNILYDITTSGRLVKEFEECKKVQSFSRAVESITDLLTILDNPAEGYSSLTMFANIKSTAVLIWDQLIIDLQNQWNQMVSYNIRTESKITTVTIKLNLDEEQPTIDALNALEVCKQMPLKIKEFGEFIMQKIMIPLILFDCNVFTENGELAIVTIKNDSPRQPFDVVLANTKKFLDYLNVKLQIEYRDSHSIMRSLGYEFGQLFSQMITNECLIHTIPNNLSDLQNYGTVAAQIEQFQNYLLDINFFSKGINMLNYMENIDVLFSDKCSQYYLETARNIMLKDLSLTMSIGVETIPDNYEPTVALDIEGMEDTLAVFEEFMPKSLFYFPRCMISKSTQELLDLIFMMMEQAIQCTDIVCKRIYTTTRLVFELYDAVVPYHHENYLQTIPQYVALFHNNCMYLAHNLLTLGDKWLALMDGRSVSYPLSFVDLVPKLRDLGSRHLVAHAQQQRRQLMDSVRGSDLNCIVVKDVLGDSAEQAIRQCLRQLQLLKNVWIGVFPLNVFTGLMATLVNMFLDEIIHRVCTVEDISAEMATQLADIYTVVVKKAPNLFQKQSDIEKNVKCWIKLQELILILGGSLKDIEKRWDDGNGPLAAHFRTEELRSLIKALFQNTQFRANLLSKMK